MSDTPQQPPVQQVYVQYQPRPSSNGLAIAALILGIVGALLSLIPLVGVFFCWLPALLAIIFGFVSLNTAKQMNGLRRKEALAGTLLGFAPIPITIIWFIIGIIGAAANGSYSS